MSRERFASALKRAQDMYVLDRIDVGQVRVAKDIAVVDTVLYGRVVAPISGGRQDCGAAVSCARGRQVERGDRRFTARPNAFWRAILPSGRSFRFASHALRETRQQLGRILARS